MSAAALAVALVLVATGCSSGGSQPAAAPSSTARSSEVIDSAVEGPPSAPAATTAPPSRVATTSSDDGDPQLPLPMLDELVVVATIPDAVTVNVATNGTDPPVVAWISRDEVNAANVDITNRGLGNAHRVNGEVEPLTHPIERPGLAVRPDGTVDLAFTSFRGSAASVYYTRREEESWTAPVVISGEPQPETNLVHIGVGDSGDVALAWLEDSTLSVAPLDDTGEPVEIELVDDLTCDCCNPAPTFVEGTLLVPYRNYEIIDGEIVRDTWSVGTLEDGSFGEPVRIADDHWFLNACPFSGPHAVTVGESLVVAFMDARQSVHPDQASTSIWVDVSRDSGLSFGPDLEVIGQGINRWPVMTVDEKGVVHLIWEVLGADGGLAYSMSADVGASFSDPVMIVANADSPGSATSPSVAYHGGMLIVTWTDGEGGRVGMMDRG